MALGYFIDVQGTLLNDINKEPIEGSKEFIKKLNDTKTPYVVVTNNTKQRSEDFYTFLVNQGFDIPKNNYLDPFMVLDTVISSKNVYGFGPQQFLDVLTSYGYTQDMDKPYAILIASSKDFNSEDYAKMIEYATKGACVIGMHATSIYAKEGKRYPGVGAILQMLSFASGKNFDIIGKPSASFYKEALNLLRMQDSSIKFQDVTMISDDAVGDLCGVKELGAKTILVLSGKCKSQEEVLHVKNSLDKIVQNISQSGEIYG